MSFRSSALTAGLVVSALLAAASPAAAMGLGVQGGYSYRTGSLDQSHALQNGFPPSVDWSSNDFRIGALLDTNVARDRLFNYRLDVSYVRSSATFPGQSWKFDYSGGEIENVFGFGLVRKPGLRWWVGPGVRLMGGGNTIDLSTPGSVVLRHAPNIEVGAGLVTGVNLHRGDHLSVGLTAAYYINWSVFEINDAVPGVFEDPQYTGSMNRFSLGIQGLYRLGGDKF